MNIIILYTIISDCSRLPPAAHSNKSQDCSALSWRGGTIAKYSESVIVHNENESRLTCFHQLTNNVSP